MSLLTFERRTKSSYGFRTKTTLVGVLGLCFIVIWFTFSSPTSSFFSQRSSFGDISESNLVDANRKGLGTVDALKSKVGHSKQENETQLAQGFKKHQGENNVTESSEQASSRSHTESVVTSSPSALPLSNKEDKRHVDGGEPAVEEEAFEEENADNRETDNTEDEDKNDYTYEKTITARMRKKGGPLFDDKAHYTWTLCNTKNGHNYIPCLDIEGKMGKTVQNHHRHIERRCPKWPPTCLVPLPEGYTPPVPWPQSETQIFYRNVAHPKLSGFIKKQNLMNISGDLLTFPQFKIKDAMLPYIDSIQEMIPDIEWGKNIRVALDIGSTDLTLVSAFLEKDVLALSLGLNIDETDLAQVSLERGYPALIGTLSTKRLPFPSFVFDTIHCGECNVPWHLNGGKLLLEMNRILRPGGYFIVSRRNDDIDAEEAMSSLIASICWNILVHKTDEVREAGMKVYQKPTSNEIYELRRKRNPPPCKEDEKKRDSTWYTPIKTCVHTVPSAIEEHGTDWPPEWPERLQTFPDWLDVSHEDLLADTERWKNIVNKSYLNGLGIDWTKIRNVMDMRSTYGGFAAALDRQNVWVLNVVQVFSPDTLPVIYERGLIGVYHDWCESFSTYPRSYDLLHADHLFARLKNRCKKPLGIVVEMDRILRPGGWAIIRDKVEILNALLTILKSLHWEVRMTYEKDKQGVICVQKTMWRP